MADLPGQASSLVNLVGVNSPQLKIATVQSPGAVQMEDVTNQKFGQVNQAVSESYQKQLQALQTMAQTRAKVAEAQGQSPSRASLSGILGTVVDTFTKVQQQHAAQKQQQFENTLKAQAAQLDQSKFQYTVAKDQQATQQGQAQAATQHTLSALLLNAEEQFQQQGSIEGIHTLRANVEAVLAEQASKLSPEALQTLQQFAFSNLHELEQKSTTIALNHAEQFRTGQESERRSGLTFALTNQLAALDNPNLTPEQTNAVLTQIGTFLTQQTADLDPLQRMNIVAPLLENMAQRATVSAAGRNAIAQKVASMGAFWQWYQTEGYPQLGNNPTALRAAALAKATQLGVPEIADMAPDTGQLLSAQRTYQEDYDKLQQIGQDRQNAALAAQAPDYLLQRSSQIAFGWLNSGDPRAQADMDRVRALGDKASTVERTALQAYTRMRGYVDNHSKLNADLAAAIEHEQSLMVRVYDAGTQEFVDTASGRAQRINVTDGTGGTLFLKQGASLEQARAAAQQVQNLQNQINRNRTDAAHGGINVDNPNDPQFIQQFQAQADATSRAAATLPRLRQEIGLPPNANGSISNQPNFNQAAGSGYPASPHVVAFARTEDNMLLPIAANHQSVVTAGFGADPAVTHHDHFHSGIDIAPLDVNEADVGALAVQGGTVINANDWNGFGGTVMVRTPDGRIEQYSHLRRLFVQEGDTVPPGSPVGVIGGGDGDPMHGSSTGRHLHFQVWQAGTTDFAPNPDGMVDPNEYLKSINLNQLTARGVGAPPSSAMGTPAPYVGAMPVPSGLPAWITNLATLNAPPQLVSPSSGVSRPASDVFNATNPIAQQNAPIDREAYPAHNNPTANYGYSVLARDKPYAAAIAELGDQLNIPGQWLADVFAYESGHDPHIDNHLDDGGWGHGYLGLIQINGDSLREYGYTYDDVMNMSRAEYVQRIARRYLEPAKGQIHTIEDLYAYINGGGGLLHRTPGSRRNVSDGNRRFFEHVQTLGNQAGRRYRTSYDLQSALPTHDNYVAGCPLCNQQINSLGSVVPHEAIG